jgi:altronate hydrolase
MATEPFEHVALRLRDDDDVAVLKHALQPGTQLLNGSPPLTALDSIPAGHKIALRALPTGAPVRKYGQIIGFATQPIKPGAHVHTHNLGMRDFERQYAIGSECKPVDYYAPEAMRHFDGFLRAGGQVGTRNYIAIISSVNCSASVSRYIAERFRDQEFRRTYPNVDGVVAFTHKSGCALQPGEPHEVLQRVLAGLARHPNIAGYVLLGLGCEVAQVHLIVKQYGLAEAKSDESTPIFMTIQNAGGVRKSVELGVAAVAKMLPAANDVRRSRQPISKLVLAENCGGSDGNSGITANPALGVASDELVRYGGTSVLAETPEIYGAEHLLVRRAVDQKVGERLLGFIQWWENHARQHNATIDNNPSYGNREGGLTTIYEKSLGAVAKGGQSPLTAVYAYAEPITAKGLCFMDTPGFDPVSMTGLVCGGCTVGVFTTGRGSVYGCKPTPCIKVATNTAIYNWMNDDMDLNAGTILDGTEPVQQVGLRIFEKIVAVASGERTKSEQAGIGDEEFAPWILGPTF